MANDNDSVKAPDAAKELTAYLDNITFFQYVQGPIVTVSVGSDATKFKVHKDLLRSKSLYFRGVLGDNWKHNNKTRLTEADVTAFGYLVHWMFKDGFPVMSQPPNTDRYTQIAITYQLADFLLMPKAKNDLIDYFIRGTSNTGIDFKTMSILSAVGVTETKLFEYCTHSCLYLTMKSEKEPAGLNEQLKDRPDAMYAVIKAVREWSVKPWAKPTIKDRCRYHDHDDGSKCVVLNM